MDYVNGRQYEHVCGACVSGMVEGHRMMEDMKCYSEKEGIKYQQCRKKLGYRTCFTQYDKSELYKL